MRFGFQIRALATIRPRQLIALVILGALSLLVFRGVDNPLIAAGVVVCWTAGVFVLEWLPLRLETISNQQFGLASAALVVFSYGIYLCQWDRLDPEDHALFAVGTDDPLVWFAIAVGLGLASAIKLSRAWDLHREQLRRLNSD